MRKFSEFKKAFFLTVILACVQGSFSQGTEVDYYGVFSPDADKNMLKMTEDLFYTQLTEMDLMLNDRRLLGSDSHASPDGIDFSMKSPKAVSFYVEIKRKGDALSKWNCTLFLKDNTSEKISSFKKEYDSYYKILMDSKSSIKGIFTDLSSYEKPHDIASKKIEKSALPSVSTENISGTWSGEESIDKIIILKGGRGFIILKNGASMNVAIGIFSENDGSKTVTVRQTSHSNASYYPELPRSMAVEAAVSALPIEYRLRLTEENVMEGTKSTLVQKNEESFPTQGTVRVVWHKAN